MDNKTSVCILIHPLYALKIRYFRMYINSLSDTSEAVHPLRARASLTCLFMRGSLAELLVILDGKDNRPRWPSQRMVLFDSGVTEYHGPDLYWKTTPLTAL